MSPQTLIVVGASTRAAAFSALRAGLQPWCIDLFADVDLQACCPVRRLPINRYPRGLVDAIAEAPNAPWIYTGGLENHPRIIERMARLRPLWGNGPDVLRIARSPSAVSEIARGAGFRYPEHRSRPPLKAASGEWIIKPLRGSGGVGIDFWYKDTPSTLTERRAYWQEFVSGDPCAAVYVGGDEGARLIGVTRQLVGEPWLHAGPFRYCGSIGPLAVSAERRNQLETLGKALAVGSRLRGLFGVDFIDGGDEVVPIEVNPRYTASVEVLERALGISALALHRRVFEEAPEGFAPPMERPPIVGKAILFADRVCTFARTGIWSEIDYSPSEPWRMPVFADVPHAGERFQAGQPVMTFFVTGDSVSACLRELRRTVLSLHGRLFDE